MKFIFFSVMSLLSVSGSAFAGECSVADQQKMTLRGIRSSLGSKEKLVESSLKVSIAPMGFLPSSACDENGPGNNVMFASFDTVDRDGERRSFVAQAFFPLGAPLNPEHLCVLQTVLINAVEKHE